MGTLDAHKSGASTPPDTASTGEATQSTTKPADDRTAQLIADAAGMGFPETMRLRLDLRYRGTEFHGWASQPGLLTVQGSIEDALALIFREPVALTVAGRTDAGVHAAHQVAHVDVPGYRVYDIVRDNDKIVTFTALKNRLNKLLTRITDRPGSEIVVTSIFDVDDTFDARFSARGRRYRYRISDRLSTHDPNTADTVLWTLRPLNEHLMRAASGALIGEHDFLSFCKPREGATTIRTLRELTIERAENGLEIDLAADAFCHSMVRSIVGALIEVGMQRRKVEWMYSLVENPSREQAAPVAPAHGLTLMGVEYGDEDDWAAQQKVTRRRRDEHK